jgi:hypothetical protein
MAGWKNTQIYYVFGWQIITILHVPGKYVWQLIVASVDNM